MKQSLSAFEIHHLENELKELVSAKVVKVYHPKKTELLFLLHIPSAGKKLLRIALPGLIYLTEFKQDMPQEPSGFCMFLRKHLTNVRISDIRQLEFERIIEIVFKPKEEELVLAIELFSKGNCIIYNKDRKILSLIEPQRWKNRSILPGKQYQYPEFQLNPNKLELNEFTEALKKSRMDKIGSALAVEFSLGGLLAEEILFRAKIPHESRPGEVNAKMLFSNLKKILAEKPKPALLFENNEPKAFSVIRLLHLKQLKSKSFSSISESLDSIFGQGIIIEQKGKKSQSYEKEINRLRKIINNQKQQIKEFEKKIKDNKRKGELIYENYKLIDDIIKTINKAREKYTWQEIAEKLKDHKKIKEINLKTKEIIIEL